jgi:MFS family permease
MISSDAAANRKPAWRSGIFIVFFIIMVCAGAAEQAMAQWASTFAESGLGVPKEIGDLFGPCAFGLFMGISRVIYAKFSHVLDLRNYIFYSSIVCVFAYLIAAFSPSPILSLICCALCGLSSGMMWPGTYSLATGRIPNMGMQVFALLALGGDLGCALGPAAAGWIAEFFGNDLKIAFGISAIFPLVIVFLLLLYVRNRKEKAKK